MYYNENGIYNSVNLINLVNPITNYLDPISEIELTKKLIIKKYIYINLIYKLMNNILK